MKNFSERLKAARKMRGWSLQELADKMGNVTKQALNKYESGTMKPSQDILLRMCTVLELSADYFNRETNITLQEVSFRKLTKLSVKDQESIKSRTLDFVERYLELEDLLGIESGFSEQELRHLPVNDYKIDIESAAEKVRSKWRLGDDPLYNVIELLEDHEIKVFEVDADHAFSGMSTWINDNIPVIVLNNNPDIPLDRKRFTALHELAHLLLEISQYTDKEQERFCHMFAGALLIPARKLKAEVGSERRDRIFFNELAQLKKQYGISIQALLFRLNFCNIITDSYLKFMMMQYSRLGYKSHEHVDYNGDERSHRFLQLVLRGVAMEIISTSKAAALQNQKLSEFRAQLT